jgi:formamidopyrimidine-DNA glycosylase
MPELPEVETTRRGIAPHIEGKRITAVKIRQPSLRWPIPSDLPQQLQRRQLRVIERRGKYLIFRFTHGSMLIHLGMSGSLCLVEPTALLRKHDHAEFIFSGKLSLRYHDPRRFGAILWAEADPYEHKLLVKLGLEPLCDAFDANYIYQQSRKRSKDIKSFIMDSHIVVGVGNIYANEALFAAGIRPTKAAGKVSGRQYERLVLAIKQVLERSITQGGTTLRDFVGGDGQPGYFAQELSVYGREGLECKKCAKPLKAIRQSQRTTVYCSHCQS